MATTLQKLTTADTQLFVRDHGDVMTIDSKYTGSVLHPYRQTVEGGQWIRNLAFRLVRVAGKVMITESFHEASKRQIKIYTMDFPSGARLVYEEGQDHHKLRAPRQDKGLVEHLWQLIEHLLAD